MRRPLSKASRLNQNWKELTIEDPHRFQKSRQVGAYLGIQPKQRDSGDCTPQLGITKAGNSSLRSLLIQCVHYLLGPFGKDCDLRRWGVQLAARGGKNAKKRAIAAVARKMAVLLHRLWVTGEDYKPFRQPQVVQAAKSFITLIVTSESRVPVTASFRRASN